MTAEAETAKMLAKKQFKSLTDVKFMAFIAPSSGVNDNRGFSLVKDIDLYFDFKGNNIKVIYLE